MRVAPIMKDFARSAGKIFRLNFQLSGWALVALSYFEDYQASLSNYLKPLMSTVAMWLPTGRVAEFVNIGRNVFFASKSEGWCALSPIAGTGSRHEYITITQEYKGRRELTQSSCPKETRGWCLLHARTRARLNSSLGTSEAWHPKVDYELVLF